MIHVNLIAMGSFRNQSSSSGSPKFTEADDKQPESVSIVFILHLHYIYINANLLY